MNEEEFIKEQLSLLEKEHNITILFAIESGSRAWKMESVDSDYDVRFVYHRPKEEYLKLHKRAETIEKAFDEEGESHTVEGSYIDMMGMDVYKYLNLLSSSNPTAIEWLSSDIKYLEPPQELVTWAENNYKPIALFYHYKSMCKSNYKKYIRTFTDLSYKRYLYSVRGALNAIYVLETNDRPPISFIDCLEELDDMQLIDANVLDRLRVLIKLKKDAKEKDISKQEHVLESFIERFLKQKDAPENVKKPVNIKELDDYLLSLYHEKESNET